MGPGWRAVPGSQAKPESLCPGHAPLPDPQISAVSSEHRAASRAVEADPAQPCWLQQDKLLSSFGQAAVRYPRATRRKERSL